MIKNRHKYWFLFIEIIKSQILFVSSQEQREEDIFSETENKDTTFLFQNVQDENIDYAKEETTIENDDCEKHFFSKQYHQQVNIDEINDKEELKMKTRNDISFDLFSVHENKQIDSIPIILNENKFTPLKKSLCIHGIEDISSAIGACLPNSCYKDFGIYCNETFNNSNQFIQEYRNMNETNEPIIKLNTQNSSLKDSSNQMVNDIDTKPHNNDTQSVPVYYLSDTLNQKNLAPIEYSLIKNETYTSKPPLINLTKIEAESIMNSNPKILESKTDGFFTTKPFPSYNATTQSSFTWSTILTIVVVLFFVIAIIFVYKKITSISKLFSCCCRRKKVKRRVFLYVKENPNSTSSPLKV